MFTIDFNLGVTWARQIDAPVMPELKESALASNARRARILVVEDDPFLLDGLRELLTSVDGAEVAYTFEVDTAANGRAGLERLTQQQPDLIISDITMPYMDGYEFLEQVRRNPAWRRIPFIFLTARRECLEIHAAQRSGDVHYLTKPYVFDELLALIGNQLNRRFLSTSNPCVS
jgi:two-component system, sensor histidine kinase and response regulator